MSASARSSVRAGLHLGSARAPPKLSGKESGTLHAPATTLEHPEPRRSRQVGRCATSFELSSSVSAALCARPRAVVAVADTPLARGHDGRPGQEEARKGGVTAIPATPRSA